MKLNSNRKKTFLESLYLPEIVKGLSVTFRHFIKNLLNWKNTATLEYPEEQPEIKENYRGRHRLKKNEDGSLKCTACMLCATVCPTRCIYIEADCSDEGSSDKKPERFEIDLLRCMFCGLCVEACPCDSIYMDTGIYAMASYDRKECILNREKLSSDITEEEKERN